MTEDRIDGGNYKSDAEMNASTEACAIALIGIATCFVLALLVALL